MAAFRRQGQMRGGWKSRIMLPSQLRDKSPWSKRIHIQSERIFKPKILSNRNKNNDYSLISKVIRKCLLLLSQKSIPSCHYLCAVQSCWCYNTSLQASVEPCWQNIGEDKDKCLLKSFFCS